MKNEKKDITRMYSMILTLGLMAGMTGCANNEQVSDNAEETTVSEETTVTAKVSENETISDSIIHLQANRIKSLAENRMLANRTGISQIKKTEVETTAKS